MKGKKGRKTKGNVLQQERKRLSGFHTQLHKLRQRQTETERERERERKREREERGLLLKIKNKRRGEV